LPHSIRSDKLRLGVNRHKDPLATKLRRISLSHMPIFLANERPDFVELQIPGAKFPHLGIGQATAMVSGDKQKAHDGVAVQARKPFCAANRAAFKKALQRTVGRFGLGEKPVPREFCVRLRKPRLTGSAFPALNAAFTEGTCLYAGDVLASDTGHGLFSACVGREKPYNQLGSGLRLTPRFGLAPTPVSAEAGALSYSALSHGGLTTTAGLPSGNRAEDFVLGEAPTNLGPFAVFAAKSSAIKRRRHSSLLHLRNRMRRISVARLLCQLPQRMFGSQLLQESDALAICDLPVLQDLRLNSANGTSRHPLQGRPDGCEWIGSIFRQVESHVVQYVTDLRRGEPLPLVLAKDEFDGTKQATALLFDLINLFLEDSLFVGRQERKGRKHQLSQFCDFHINRIALAAKGGDALNIFHEQFVIVNLCA